MRDKGELLAVLARQGRCVLMGSSTAHGHDRILLDSPEMSDLLHRGGGAEGSVPDIEFRFNQMELPDELPDDFATIVVPDAPRRKGVWPLDCCNCRGFYDQPVECRRSSVSGNCALRLAVR